MLSAKYIKQDFHMNTERGQGPFNYFAFQSTMDDTDDVRRVAHYQQALDEVQEKREFVVATNLKAHHSPGHCFLTTTKTDWKYFNILTMGQGTITELEEAIKHLEEMITVARKWTDLIRIRIPHFNSTQPAEDEPWIPELNFPGEVGLHFHCFPYNSVQSLHMHVTDLQNRHPTPSSTKNVQAEVVLKALQQEQRERNETVRIVSYNILSPELMEPFESKKDYPSDSINNELRWKKILRTLLLHVEHKAIICLQEVTQEWKDRLHTWFKEYKYKMVFCAYKNNMGNVIAWPTNSSRYTKTGQILAVENVNDQFTTSDLTKRAFAQNQKQKEAGHDQKAFVAVRFELRAKTDFCVGCWHGLVPTEERRPEIERALNQKVIDSLKRYAGNTPYILAGDFNSTIDNEIMQPIKEHTSSAYGDDPHNPVSTRTDSFVGRIDHIQVSKHVTVKSVLPLPRVDTLERMGAVFPNIFDQGSDHLPIAANVEFRSVRTI